MLENNRKITITLFWGIKWQFSQQQIKLLVIQLHISWKIYALGMTYNKPSATGLVYREFVSNSKVLDVDNPRDDWQQLNGSEPDVPS